MNICGIPIEDINKLRDDITLNFGSIHAFMKATGFPYRKSKRVLISLEFKQEEFYELKKAYKKNVDLSKVPFRIPTEDRNKIRICIQINFINYTKFCDEYPEFNCVYITNIVKGRLKLRTEKYNSLVRILKKYNLKLN